MPSHGQCHCKRAPAGHGNTAAAKCDLLDVDPVSVLQVHSMVQRLAQHTDVRVALVVGGLSLQSQATALRARPEIVVATPVWCLG